MTNQKAQIISRVSLLVIVGSIAALGVHELSGSSAQTPTTPAFVTEVARPANDFLNSMGINTHMGAAAYAQSDKTLASLNQLGVRWVRDDTSPTSAKAIAGDKAIVGGGKKLEIVKSYAGQKAIPNYNTAILNMIKANFPTSVIGVEGINEPDNNAFIPTSEANWVSVICSDQPNLYNTFKGTGIPILEPGLMGINVVTKSGGAGYGVQLQKGCPNIGNYADYGNMHTYPGGLPPETNVSDHIGYVRTYEGTGQKPIAFTETGYDTALLNQAGNFPVSEAAQAVYIPRLYLSYFAQGVARTAPYELVDQGNDQTDQEKTFGLYHNDWSPKPAALAVANMTSILADSVSKPAGSLKYALSDTSVSHLLLQKSDGSYYLALWRNSSVWNAVKTPGIQTVKNNNTVVAASSNVTLTLPQNMQITTYQPNSSASATQAVVTAASKTVSVGPEVVILKVSGSTTSTPTPPTTTTPNPTPGAAAKPDLIVQTIGGYSTTSTHAGDRLTFTAVVKNIGTAATPAGTILGVGFKIDGTEVTWTDTDTSSLVPGASVTLTSNSGPNKVNYWTATLGTHSILANVDDVNRIVEADETNNKLSQTFVVSAQPPLPVTPGGVIIIGTGKSSSSGGKTAVPGADQPITVISATGKTSTVNPFAKPVVSGSISLVNPTSAPKGTTTALYIDGKRLNTTPGAAAKVDTTYLSNGEHVLTLVSKKPDGTSVYTSRDFKVTNSLTPYQKVRDSVYRKINSKPVANIVATGTILSPPTALIVVAVVYRHTIFGFIHHCTVRIKQLV